MPEDLWIRFKNNPGPLTKIRPFHDALQAAAGKGNCPGLNVLFAEARERGTVMGVGILRVGSRIYLPRESLVRRVEGR